MIRFLSKAPRRKLFVALAVPIMLFSCFFTFTPVYAQDSTTIKLPTFGKIYGHYAQARDLLEEIEGMLTNYQKCLVLHGDANKCASATVMCKLQELALNQVYPGFVGQLQVLGAFQIYCGAGECFQCCKTSNGCHTSFKGFPVINCNPVVYGAGTFPAGMALITDPNAQPGQSCLFTGQICDHLPVCRYTPGANIEDLENNLKPDDPLNWDHARDQRAQFYGEFLQEQLQNFLDDFLTGEFADPNLATAASISAFAQLNTPASLYELGYFISGRGCQQWRSHMTGGYPFDWADPLFAITDTNGIVLPEASHWNGLQQLATWRMLASVPNVRQRLDYTDSRVWSQASKSAYLAQVGDPDAVLLRYMSPYALAILKGVYSIQDYRLLAVPRPDEPVLGNQFNGCTLGQAPRLALKATNLSADTVAVEVTVTNAEAAQSTQPSVMVFDWGDGSVSHVDYPATQEKVSATHTYAVPGKRVVLALTDSESGLRGLGAQVVEVTGGTATVTPAIAQVTLQNLSAQVNTLSGNEWQTFFELHLTDPQSRTIGAGRTAYQLVKFNQETSFGQVHVDNPGRYPFDKVVIKPYTGQGFTIGFREHYITLDGLTLAVYASALDAYITRTLPITIPMIQVYPIGSSTPLASTALTVTNTGKVKIPLQRRVGPTVETMDRIELLVDPAWLHDLIIPDAADYTVGDVRFLQEVRPGTFVSDQTLTFGALPERTFGEAPFTVEVTASSDLSVTVTTTTGEVCTVTSNQVILLNAGLCTLVATQPGNDEFLAQSLNQSFTINKASQSISFGPLVDQPLTTSPLSFTATASSQLTVTLVSLTPATCTVDVPTGGVRLVSPGLCTLTASQGGDRNYLAAPDVVQSFTIRAAVYLPTIKR